jgi:signal peptidase I
LLASAVRVVLAGMHGNRLIGAVLATLLFPGFGQALAAHRRAAAAWCALGTLTVLAIVVSVWMLPATLAVRLAAAVDAARRLRHEEPSPGSRYASATLAIVIGALGLGGAGFAVDTYKIPSSSMSPTLLIGDHVYVDTVSVRWRAPARGDVIVFEFPCQRALKYIKRVIAIGGDTIEVRCDRVYVNGVALPGDSAAPLPTHDSRTAGAHDFPVLDLARAPSCRNSDFYDVPDAVPTGEVVRTVASAPPCAPQLHYTVPPDTYFVLGDNRHNANDSRYWGVVPRSHVVGRAIGIWLSGGDGGGWAKTARRFGGVD